MTFAYKAKSKKQKKKTPTSRGKIVSSFDSNIAAYNDVRIFYRTPYNDSNNCVQRVKFINRYFASETDDYIWSQEYKNKVNEAIQSAVEHLNKSLQDELVKNKQSILEAIRAVIDVLQNQELEIFPFSQDYGQAAQDQLQISINMEHLCDDTYGQAKTLIHEAFHIIGGCQNKRNDCTCRDDISKEEAFKKIHRRRDIRTMPADYFAQFVMKC